MKRDPAIDSLLDLHGSILDQGDGYWIKIDAWLVDVSKDIPHGIRYSLTLHEPYGKRLLGYDNAHAVSLQKSSSMPDASSLLITNICMPRTKACLTNSRMCSN